jgi:hypothetical protein
MAYADYPSQEIWQQREQWLQETEESFQHPLGSYELSAHGIFVSRDLDLAFCSGAWVAVIILSHVIIDAVVRDTEFDDYKSSSFKLFGDDTELHWLRMKRNELVHVREVSSVIDPGELDKIESYYGAMEEDARRAVKSVFRIMYANPGT